LLLEQDEVIIRERIKINKTTEVYTYVDILISPMKGRTQAEFRRECGLGRVLSQIYCYQHTIYSSR
jgi:hypothetical protein